MFKRRSPTTIMTVALVAAILGPDPVRAQAPLGFAIGSTQGYPGDTVTGQVDVADVIASCVTDLGTFQARFQALFDGPYVDGANSGDFFNFFFPGGDFVFDNYNQTAYSLTGFVVLGIAADFNGATELAFPQTFVMTFAEIATQKPVGELGHFDPTTGAGSVVVPNIAPGLWAVAAACVGPSLDLSVLEAGIEASGTFLQSIGMPTPDLNDATTLQPWLDSYLFPGATEEDLLLAIGPTLIQNIVTPDALGAQLFTIPQCGNGKVELGEQCDDGNTADGDCCSAACQFEAAGSACVADADTCTADVCDGAGSCTHPLICTDVPIDGHQLAIKHKQSGSQNLVFMSKDPDAPFPAPGGPNDPRTVGATLEILTQGEGMATFELPAANWTANRGGTVFKFVNEQAPSGPSAVKVSVLKQGKMLKIEVRNTGVPLVNPLVRAAARFRTGLTRSCALFEPSTVKHDQTGEFVAKDAVAPAVSDCSDAALGFGS